MGFNLRLNIRIDDSVTNEIWRFKKERSPIVYDVSSSKLYRLKMINGIFNTQEITITDGVIVEIGDPIAYVKA